MKQTGMSEVNKKLGILLKKERERQNIKIDDLSERLKISVSNLQSIEAGTTDGLPSDLYFSLFAKSYAESLGIDHSRTIEAIKLDCEETNDNSQKSKGSEKKQSDSSDEKTEAESLIAKKTGIVFAVIITLSLIFLVVNHFFFNSEPSDSSTDSVDTQTENSSKTSQEL